MSSVCRCAPSVEAVEIMLAKHPRDEVRTSMAAGVPTGNGGSADVFSSKA